MRVEGDYLWGSGRFCRFWQVIRVAVYIIWVKNGRGEEWKRLWSDKGRYRAARAARKEPKR